MLTNAKIALQHIETLKQHPWITIDLEYFSRNTFTPELCLIQLASPDQVVLIDAQAEDIQENLYDIFESLLQAQLLIFFSGRQDWQIINHHYPWVDILPATNILDLQYASIYYQMHPTPSLTNVADKLLGKSKISHQQASDWRLRPLSEKQLQYAEDDVTLLIELYEKILRDLSAEQFNAMREDTQFAISQMYDKLTKPIHPKQHFKLVEFDNKTCLKLQIFVNIRLRLAREINRPIQWVISDIQAERIILENTTVNFASAMQQNGTKYRQPQLEELNDSINTVNQLTDEQIEQQLMPIFSAPPTIDQEHIQDILEQIKQHCNKINLDIRYVAGKSSVQQLIKKPSKSALNTGWRHLLVTQYIKTSNPHTATIPSPNSTPNPTPPILPH